jgi:hypothetical protein
MKKIQINSPFVHSHILIRVMKGAPRVLDYYHVEVNEALNFGRQSGCTEFHNKVGCGQEGKFRFSSTVFGEIFEHNWLRPECFQVQSVKVSEPMTALQILVNTNLQA